MPSRWLIHLEDTDPEQVRPEHLHATACRWLDQSGDAHRSNVQPFALSPLAPAVGGAAFLELSLLGDTLAKSVVDRLDGEAGHKLRLGRTSPRLGVSPAQCTTHAAWPDLVEQARPVDRWEFRFLSPMLTRRGNDDLPLPLPGSIVSSLQRRWSAFATCDLNGGRRSSSDAPLGNVARVKLSSFDGCSSTITVRRRDRLGFVGSVVLVADRSASEDDRRRTDALFGLARFSGVGAMTTYGLGVTEVARS